MSFRPGTQVSVIDSTPPRSAVADASTFFVAGFTEKGDHTEAVKVTSMAQFEDLFGARVSHGQVWDALGVFFREGGSQAYVGRVVGPAVANATINIMDQSGSSAPGDVALVATASSSGSWANSLNVVVTQPDGAGAAAVFVLEVTHDTDGTLETSPELADRAEAIAWADGSDYITLALGASAENPRAASYSLAAGTDDYASATDTHWENALNLFTKDLGPGQVAMPGRTTTQAHTDLAEHANAKNRRALLDLADTPTVATLTTAGEAVRDLGENARLVLPLAPWIVVPGVLPGTERTLPPSGMVAGIIARNDQAGRSANEPSANELGKSRFATGVSQAAWSDEDRDTLNSAGVNVVRNMLGGVRLYGYRTAVDPLGADADWLNFANSRLLMAITAKADTIAERYVLRQLDGKGHTIAQFGGELRGMLLPYFTSGSLYGQTPDEAFVVDVGPNVNTEETIADGQLRAIIGARMSAFAELVTIELVKVPVNEAIA